MDIDQRALSQHRCNKTIYLIYLTSLTLLSKMHTQMHMGASHLLPYIEHSTAPVCALSKAQAWCPLRATIQHLMPPYNTIQPARYPSPISQQTQMAVQGS